MQRGALSELEMASFVRKDDVVVLAGARMVKLTGKITSSLSKFIGPGDVKKSQ